MTDKSRKALEELVACKDLKEQADAISPLEPGFEKEILRAEYNKRLPLAWANARAVLATAPAEPPKMQKALAGLVACKDRLIAEYAAGLNEIAHPEHASRVDAIGECFDKAWTAARDVLRTTNLDNENRNLVPIQGGERNAPPKEVAALIERLRAEAQDIVRLSVGQLRLEDQLEWQAADALARLSK